MAHILYKQMFLLHTIYQFWTVHYSTSCVAPIALDAATAIAELGPGGTEPELNIPDAGEEDVELGPRW